MSPETTTDKPRVVLTIAGFDPSSGAGVTADIKTIAAHGCYGVACITALTVQSTAGVLRVEPVDPALVSETLQELASDIAIDAIHIGMLATSKVVKAVAEFLAGSKAAGAGQARSASKFPNIVLDPILKSSSGADLLDPSGTKLLIERLIPLADVITPNLDEAAILTGIKVTDLDEMRAATVKLHEMGSPAVVVTGGHLDKAIDLLSFKTKEGVQEEVFKADRQRSNSTHGLRLFFGDGMRTGSWTRLIRSCFVGQNLCGRGHRRRPSPGTRRRSGASSLPDEPAAPGGRFERQGLGSSLGKH
jgi:hydroxymethylpyrimidine/phosphomethylpyrimidine kinase